MDQRRLFLAIALSLVIIVLYQELYLKKRIQQGQPPPIPTSEQRPSVTEPSTASPSTPPEAAPPAELSAPVGDEPRVTIDTDVFHIVVTTRGARLLSLELQRFRQAVQPTSPLLDLIQLGPVLPL